jgi:dolichol-phosphate mannosyltransferase
MLSLILPTYSEAENIPELLPKVRDVLKDLPHEIIIVDDNSPDETWKVAQKLAHDREDIHVIRRIDRRGLSSAVIDGFLAAKGDVFMVMDADGQHDMKLLPKLYDSVKHTNGIAIGSRYVEGGSVGEWDEQRYAMSRIATKLAKRLCAVQVQDPMSGFFAIDRSVFEEVLPRLNPKGFKILLDLLVHVPSTIPVDELPFTFGSRTHGESKLSRRVQIEFLEYLYDVIFGKYIPLAFVKYCVVGSLGVLVNVMAFQVFHGMVDFSSAVIAAIETAIIFNFWMNNIWTFSHARLQGKAVFVGLLKFNIACALGGIANYSISTYLFENGVSGIIAVSIGAFTSVLWNYTMNKIFTWKT